MSVNNAAGTIIEKRTDETGAKMGMWLFLFTELLFFSGMFLLYAVYRSEYLGEFHSAALELSLTIGGINTIILITSSLTMALPPDTSIIPPRPPAPAVDSAEKRANSAPLAHP